MSDQVRVPLVHSGGSADGIVSFRGPGVAHRIRRGGSAGDLHIFPLCRGAIACPLHRKKEKNTEEINREEKGEN